MRELNEPIVIDDFAGLYSNRGKFPKHPSEAKVQTNLRAERPGQLSVRKEPEAVTFATGIISPAASENYISLFEYVSPGNERFIIAEAGSDYDVHAFRLP